MKHYYIEEHGLPVPAPTVKAWAAWIAEQGDQRTLACTHVGTSEITTCFVGINMADSDADDPIVYQTTVNGGLLNGASWRYASRTLARRHHDTVVAIVKASVLS